MLGMSALWLDSKTPVGPPASASPTVRNLLYAAAVTGGWSGLLCLLVYAIGWLAGVPFAMVARSGAEPTVVPWLVVLLTPVVAAVGGALLASLVRGWRHAGRIVFWVGTLVVLMSALVPLAQPAEVLWSSRILLLLMHGITWLLVVPQLARIVGDSEPGQHVDRSG
jgi:hypothetical protein